jgi:hypothetical protein
MSSGVSANPLPRNEHDKIPLEHINQHVGLKPKSEEREQLWFPDSGSRAWTVAAACAGILFCTFGYINAFG